MKLISESSEIADIKLVGGKGSHLQKLKSWKAEVPPFFVLTTECFEYFQKHQSFPAEVHKRFEKFLALYPQVALRSSMISEDNVESSFAGMFDTLLDVEESNWHSSLLKIYESLQSPRVREYILKKELRVDLKMAVVVQKLIQVEKSGVLFTRSPVPPTAAIAVDAAFGLGEGVVSGHADVDHYKLTRTGEIIQSLVRNKEEVLNKEELQALMAKALELEKCAGYPADIEWGYKDGRLFIFQLRPITRIFEPITYYVDTNLSESYPGVVSPFTADFVRKAYTNVFTESAVILGASGAKLKKLTRHYQNLINAVDDHLYYNLEHYYAVLRALPGGEKNIENWHKMIGGRIEGHQIRRHETNLDRFETFIALTNLLKLGLSRKKKIQPFLFELNRKKAEIEDQIRKLKDPNDIIFYLDHLIGHPLGFGITIINDVFVMIGIGMLSRRLKRQGHSDEVLMDLLKTSNGVDSLKPLECFNELAMRIDEPFLECFLNADLRAGWDPYSDFFTDMKSKGFREQVSLLENFIKEFGDRSFEELKLESLPLKNNPLLLKQLLRWARNNTSIVIPEQQMSNDLSLGWLERKVLDFTRSSIETREATRLWRGKYYHLVRELVLTLAKSLRARNPAWLSCSILDFFSVTSDEWLSFAKGMTSAEQIQELMHKRRSWQTKSQSFPEVIAWVENEPLPQFAFTSVAVGLNGQGVSQGIAEGTALVLERPEDAFSSEVKDFILVTRNTDPAWVYIMSRSKGLISEKGSLLSHTAIIGRELNLPTIVGVKDATRKLKTGDKIRIDASSGKIEII